MTRNPVSEGVPSGQGGLVRLLRSLGHVASLAILVGSTAHCGSDTPVATRPDPATLFWSLGVSDKAVALAVGETLQLTATPYYSSGAVIPDLPAPTFTSLDPGKVAVDANGVIRGVAPTGGVQVVVSLQSQGITHTDTVNVVVTPTAMPVATFSIHPVPPDSAIVPTGSLLFITPTIREANGNDLFAIPFAIDFTDSSKVAFVFGSVITESLGPIGIVASTNAYGVRFRDSVEYLVTYPTSNTVTIDSATSTFRPASATLQAYGSVTWYNLSLIPADVTFDDPTHVDGGNITAIATNDVAVRTFRTPGTYTYHGSSPNLTGRVVVH